jgi:ligand-binding sensor protein
LIFLDACYRAEAKELAAKVKASIKQDLEQQIKYYNSLSGRNAENMSEEKRTAESYLQALNQMEKMYEAKVAAVENGKTIVNDSSKGKKEAGKK